MKHRFFIAVIILSSFLSILICNCALNRSGQKSNKLKHCMENTTPIEKYRLEVAYQINKNWNFDSKMNSKPSQVTSLVFRIMPDGKIKNIFFTKRSGNEAMDESAFNAIVKTNPTKPFPHNINKPFIEMGINFRPDCAK